MDRSSDSTLPTDVLSQQPIGVWRHDAPHMPEQLPVDLRLLESFVVLAEELHFTRAAARLHVAQPALSQQIARLERQLGTQLLTRRPQPIALTSAGRELLERARPALRDLRTAIDASRAAGGGAAGAIALGHLSSFGPRVVPALTRALAERHPDIELHARECSVEEQLEGLHDRTLDVGLFYLDREVTPDDPALTLSPIVSGPHYVALPPAHRFAGRPSVPLDQLADEAWVMPSGTGQPGYQAAFFMAICARHGFAPRVRSHANSIETMLGMVSAGIGIAPAPWTVLLRPPPDLAFVETPGESFDVVAATIVPRVGDRVLEVARDVLVELRLSVARTAR